MSKELDDRVDALRRRLISTAGTPVSMGNYKQQLRTYQEMMLELINITDAVNAQGDVDAGALSALKMQLAEVLSKHHEGDK